MNEIIEQGMKWIQIYLRLSKIAKRLHKLDENYCNYGWSKYQETREKNLTNEARNLAEMLNLKIHRQGDPRGCPLYLITKDMGSTNYSQGIAIEW